MFCAAFYYSLELKRERERERERERYCFIEEAADSNRAKNMKENPETGIDKELKGHTGFQFM